jgi:hypothetical protein
MAAAFLAKLKINNPPEVKQQIEIKIRRNPEIKAQEGQPAKAKQSAKVQPAEVEAQVRKLTIIDESKTNQFDRNTFLQSIRKDPDVLKAYNPVIQEEPVLQVDPTVSKKKTTRKIKPSKKDTIATSIQIDEVVPKITMEEILMPQPAVPTETTVPADTAETAAPGELKPKKITIRRTKKPIVGVKEGILPLATTIGDADIQTRLKKKNEASIVIPASSYYMNNREIFVNFMASLFNKYKKNLSDEAATPATCPGDNDVNEFSLMTHQQIVRDYLNLYSPYRGLLLYHGLGSGKTCSSIAIAEGLKNAKPIIIMTPASLQVNYREELKKCGDELYKKNQFWEFVRTKSDDTELIDTLSSVLSLSIDYINKNGGAWMVNMSKPANYDKLASSDKLKLDDQIDKMIAHKYRFINYNGLRMSKILELTENNTINPFDNSVVIVDEAHNLVSRIVNKLSKKQANISMSLYNLLLKAKNAKIVLLSGTPIINYPNEISILFNILRGYIKSWSFKLDIMAERQINTNYIQSLFKSSVLGGNILDYLEYKPASTTLVITRNPFGFVNKTSIKDNTYNGVKFEIGERGEISDETFISLVTSILKKQNIIVKPNAISMHEYKALPDSLDEFKGYFIEENGQLKNMNMFKRRILGLTSYFRSAQESLMPRYEKENPADFQIIKIPMSDFQFGVYEEARVQERTQERKNAMKKKLKKPGVEGLYENTTSTYRIFSRAFCNFVFPKPSITRPMPDKKNKKGEEVDLAEAVNMIDEDDLDAVTSREKANRDEAFDADGDGDRDDDRDDEDGDAEGEGAKTGKDKISYKSRIQNALKMLEKDSSKYLTPEGLQIYSPKFLNILENIQDEDHQGIHLLYTQFRALEGIGILKLILEANGFTQFKIKKVGEIWDLAIPEEDSGKPTFALYTGTESTEEKEIIRNVLNNAWKYVPETIVRKLKEIAPNNTMGKIIKVLMITSSGAEGISLKNVRYVHITEPYWHPVRIEQVIGRARRICSHQELPVELRTVSVFLYIMTLSEKQLSSDDTIELRLKDKSRKDDVTPVSTDETIYEIASAKEDITTTILKSVKEASIDCALHLKANTNEKLQCFSFGSNDSSKFSYDLAIENEQSDTIADKNKKQTTWKAKKYKIGDTYYALNVDTNEVYDLESYMNKNPMKIGNLVKLANGNYDLEFI